MVQITVLGLSKEASRCMDSKPNREMKHDCPVSLFNPFSLNNEGVHTGRPYWGRVIIIQDS